MSNQPNKELDSRLKMLESLPKASPSEDFEDRLFEHLEKEFQSIQKDESISLWIKWSIAALITLAITNVFVLTQQTSKAGELESLLFEPLNEEYYYGQELFSIDEP